MADVTQNRTAGLRPASRLFTYVDLVRGHRGLSRLILASLLSLSGSQICRVALILHVFGTFPTVLELALLVLFETLPGAIAAPFAGALVDRLPKRAVMIVADLLRMAFMAAVLLMPSYAMICVMVALHSVVTVFFQPAKDACIPLLARDRLLEANGLDQSSTSLVFVLAPAVGAALFMTFGLGAALMIDIATFFASAALIAGISLPRVRPTTALSFSGVIEEARIGIGYVVDHPLALRLTAVFFLALVCTGVWLPVAPYFLTEQVGASPEALGWQLGVLGFGALLGGLFAPSIAARVGRGTLLRAGLVVEALLQVLYALTSDIWLSHLLVGLWGASTTVIVVPFYAILQNAVATDFLGRVFALLRQAELLALSAATTLVFFLHAHVGSRDLILAGGLAYLALALIFALLPRTRSVLRHA